MKVFNNIKKLYFIWPNYCLIGNKAVVQWTSLWVGNYVEHALNGTSVKEYIDKFYQMFLEKWYPF